MKLTPHQPITTTIEPDYLKYWQELEKFTKENIGFLPTMNDSINMAVKYYVSEAPVIKTEKLKLMRENKMLRDELHSKKMALKLLKSIIYCKNKILNKTNDKLTV